jgi:hypothetical protein
MIGDTPVSTARNLRRIPSAHRLKVGRDLSSAIDGNGSDAPERGIAANASGKSLQCGAHTPYAHFCFLFGGQKLIAKGLMAIYHFKIRPTAEAGTTTLRVEKTESSTFDSMK